MNAIMLTLTLLSGADAAVESRDFDGDGQPDLLLDRALPRNVLLFVAADWCPSCQKLKPTIAKLKEKGVAIVEIDVTRRHKVQQALRVRELPTLIAWRNGQETARHEGYDLAAKKLRELEGIKDEPQTKTTAVVPPERETVSWTRVPKGKWLDVLPFVELKKDRVKGNWSRGRDGVLAMDGWHSRIQLPVQIEGDYDLEIDFTRIAVGGSNSVNVIFPVGQRTCGLVLAGWGGQVHGLQMVDGREPTDERNPASVRPGTLVNGQRYSVRIAVRTDGEDVFIEATLDGKLLLKWAGKKASLSIQDHWKSGDGKRPAVGMNGCKVEFHTARVRLVSGRSMLREQKAAEPAAESGASTPGNVRNTDRPVAATGRAQSDEEFLAEAAKKLAGLSMDWRFDTRRRMLWANPNRWYGLLVPYIVLPYPQDEAGKEKLKAFRRMSAAALEILGSNDRCTVLTEPEHPPEVSAKIIKTLGLTQSPEDAKRLRSGRSHWLDFRLAVVRPGDHGPGAPRPLPGGPSAEQIADYRQLLLDKGPNGGRHRGDAYLYYRRLDFCQVAPELVVTVTKREGPAKAGECVLLSDKPGQVLLCGSRRPRPWHLTGVSVTDDPNVRPALVLELDENAARQMGKLTEAHRGCALAAVFHHAVFAVVTIREKTSDKVVLSGPGLSKELLEQIARSLSACMLAEAESPGRQPTAAEGWTGASFDREF